jgi:hypothetical protein
VPEEPGNVDIPAVDEFPKVSAKAIGKCPRREIANKTRAKRNVRT